MRLFTDRETKLIGIVVGSATLLALIITIIVGLSRPRTQTGTTNGGIAGRAGGGENTAADQLSVWELEIPDEYVITGPEPWYVYREGVRRWSDDQIDRFWIDPVEIRIERLREETDARVEDFFENLP